MRPPALAYPTSPAIVGRRLASASSASRARWVLNRGPCIMISAWAYPWVATGKAPANSSGPRTSRGSSCTPSASLTNLLCNRCKVCTPIVGADTFDSLLCAEEACWCHHRPFAMPPSWFNRVEPRAFAGELTDDQAAAACALDALIVGFEPLAYDLTEVPGGLIPDQA